MYKNREYDCRVNDACFNWIRLASIAFSVILLNSCIPPVWDWFDAINKTDAIKPGITTREEVIKKLGQPTWQNSTDRSIHYSGEKSMGLLILPAGYQAYIGLLGERNWTIAIYFDENDVVTRVSTTGMVENHGQTQSIAGIDIETSPHSSPGNEYTAWNSNTIGIAKEAGIYCPNADLGHADAQLKIASLYHTGAYDQKVDLVRAWVWYHLAAQNGDVQAAHQLSELTAKLSPEQLEEARRQLAAWKPGQCMRELTADQKGPEVP